jgi:hypothetical protein
MFVERIAGAAGAPHLSIRGLEGRIMFTIETYQDVLSVNSRRGHIVSSGWIVVAVIAVMVALFA